MLNDASDTTWHWRATLMGGVVPNILGAFLVIKYIPESPRHLLVWNKKDRVRDVMVLIAHINGCPEKLGGKNVCKLSFVISPFETKPDL
jgi:hypothetical protein